MPTSPIAIGLTVLTLGICLFALWKGGQAERLGGGLILANALLGNLGDFFFPHADLAVVWLVGDGASVQAVKSALPPTSAPKSASPPSSKKMAGAWNTSAASYRVRLRLLCANALSAPPRSMRH